MPSLQHENQFKLVERKLNRLRVTVLTKLPYEHPLLELMDKLMKIIAPQVTDLRAICVRLFRLTLVERIQNWNESTSDNDTIHSLITSIISEIELLENNGKNSQTEPIVDTNPIVEENPEVPVPEIPRIDERTEKDLEVVNSGTFEDVDGVQQPPMSDASPTCSSKQAVPHNSHSTRLPKTCSMLGSNFLYKLSGWEILKMDTTLFEEIEHEFIEQAVEKVPDSVKQNGEKLKVCEPTTVAIGSNKAADLEGFRSLLLGEHAVLIKNMVEVRGMDMSQFSTETICAAFPDNQVDLLKQKWIECGDLGNKKSWKFTNSRLEEGMKISDYKLYQDDKRNKESEDTVEPPKKKSKNKTGEPAKKKTKKEKGAPKVFVFDDKFLFFGSNLDLVDETVFKSQLDELKKLPSILECNGVSDMLSFINEKILGMNTPQVYVKIGGVRTPAHQENMKCCSININVGPGVCVWYCVPDEYWGVVADFCKRHKRRFLDQPYWPNVDDLLKSNVPVTKIVQHPGEIVFIGYGCIHWVQSTGVCNNVAWNVAPMEIEQLEHMLEREQYNKFKGVRSIVRMARMTWEIAEKAVDIDARLAKKLRQVLCQSLAFSKMADDVAKHHQLPELKEFDGSLVCKCKKECFQTIFVKQVESEQIAFCSYCADKQKYQKFSVYREKEFADLVGIYDKLREKYESN